MTPASLEYSTLEPPTQDLRSWIESAWGPRAGFVIAHFFDAMTWGVLREGALFLPPSTETRLRTQTLVDLRAFGEGRELRVFRQGHPLRALLVRAFGSEVGSGETGRVRRFEHSRSQVYRLLGNPRSAEGRFALRVGHGGHECYTPAGLDEVTIVHYYSADPTTGLLDAAEHRWEGLGDLP